MFDKTSQRNEGRIDESAPATTQSESHGGSLSFCAFVPFPRVLKSHKWSGRCAFHSQRKAEVRERWLSRKREKGKKKPETSTFFFVSVLSTFTARFLFLSLSLARASCNFPCSTPLPHALLARRGEQLASTSFVLHSFRFPVERRSTSPSNSPFFFQTNLSLLLHQ